MVFEKIVSNTISKPIESDHRRLVLGKVTKITPRELNFSRSYRAVCCLLRTREHSGNIKLRNNVAQICGECTQSDPAPYTSRRVAVQFSISHQFITFIRRAVPYFSATLIARSFGRRCKCPHARTVFQLQIAAINGTVRIIYRETSFPQFRPTAGNANGSLCEKFDARIPFLSRYVRRFGASECARGYRGTQEGAGYPRDYPDPEPRFGSGAAVRVRTRTRSPRRCPTLTRPNRR